MKTLTITRWIYNEKEVEFENSIATIEETKGTVTIEVKSIVKETEKAICINTMDCEMSIITIWLPRTQIKGANFEVKTLEAQKTDYIEYGRYNSAVEAGRVERALKEEGKKAFTKYVKNDCIVMVAA